jgi:hypothetical protein
MLNNIAAVVRQAEPINRSDDQFRGAWIEWHKAAKDIAVSLTDSQTEYDWFCKLVNII